MTDKIGYTRKGDIAVLRISNPPVNALSHAVREGLVAGMDRAEADDGVKAVAGDHGVQVIGGGVAELDFFPEVAPARAHDPRGIGAQLADVIRYGDDLLLRQELADTAVGVCNALLVVLGAGGWLQLGQLAVAMTLQGIDGPQAVQFPFTQHDQFRRGPRHQLHVL